MNIEITKISIKKTIIAEGKAVHLSLDGAPINPYSPLWKKTRPDNPDDPVTTVTNPAAFTAKAFEDLVLEVTLLITDGKDGKYQLYGYDATKNIEKASAALQSVSSFSIDYPAGTEIPIEVNRVNLLTPKTQYLMELRIEDVIVWYIAKTEVYPPDGPEIGKTELEIYKLQDGGDFSFFRRGVPVEILRSLDIIYINYLNSTNNKVSIENLVEYIVKACFFRNPPRYDIYRGAPHFSSLNKNDKDLTVTGGIFLSMYLNALNDTDALCNCKDQAAALYAFLSALGIGNVDICVMDPFGYLKLSMLVGRGFVNNPIYKGNRENKIVRQHSPQRKPFNYHYFCAWENNTSPKKSEEERILDACVGPHTGSENKEKYVSTAIDKEYPKNGKTPGTAKNIKKYKVKAIVDYIPRQPLEKDPEEEKLYFVVCEWGDPRACPVLGLDWNIEYEKIFAGDIEVLKVWKLRKKGESIQINLYVNSSSNTEVTKNRFLSIPQSASYQDDKDPYENGETYLGKMAAQKCFENVRHVFWVPHFISLGLSNVVFDVMCTNATFNVDALLVWLNEMALTRKARSIKNFKPCMKRLTFTQEEPKVENKIKVSMKTTKNLMLDFLLEKDSGLRLIDQDDYYTGNFGPRYINPEKEFYLEFIAFKKTQNKLRMIAVDKDTLLCNSKDIHINLK